MLKNHINIYYAYILLDSSCSQYGKLGDSKSSPKIINKIWFHWYSLSLFVCYSCLLAYLLFLFSPTLVDQITTPFFFLQVVRIDCSNLRRIKEGPKFLFTSHATRCGVGRTKTEIKSFLLEHFRIRARKSISLGFHQSIFTRVLWNG